MFSMILVNFINKIITRCRWLELCTLNLRMLEKKTYFTFVRYYYRLLVTTYVADKYSKLLSDKEMKSASRMNEKGQNICLCPYLSILRQYYGRVFDDSKLVNARKVMEQTSVHDNGNYYDHDCDVCNEILCVSARLNAVLEWQLSWLL